MPTASLLQTAALAGLLMATSPAGAAEPPAVTYDDHVKPIFREHCLRCHGDDTQKADLNLQSYAGVLKGGSGGEVVKAGRAAASILYQAVAREGEAAAMPPSRPKIAEAQVAVIRAWIDGGLRESASSGSKTARKPVEFRPAAGDKLAGPGAMPDNLPAVNLPAPRRPHPVTALAASPRAPLVAVAGRDRILLHHSATRRLLGTLPFPEGVPNVLRFSRDGVLLLAAGGKPVQSGKAVLFDVRTGKRLTEVGDETDAVLAADLSPDQQLLALGGSGKTVKVYSTRDGKLLYTLGKHTDWITALAFSPDGQRLASADRAGAVHLWEAKSGGIILTLSGHKDAVLALDWRGDSRMLATGSEDGQLIWWDANDGWPARTVSPAHAPKPPPGSYGKLPGGVLGVAFAADGRLVSCGRDRLVKMWNIDGGVSHFEPGALPLRAVVSADGSAVIAGDAVGGLHFWPAGPKK